MYTPMPQGATGPALAISVIQTNGQPFLMVGATLSSFTLLLRPLDSQQDYTCQGTWSNLVVLSGQVQFNWNPADTAVVNKYKLILKITIGGVIYIPKPVDFEITAT